MSKEIDDFLFAPSPVNAPPPIVAAPNPAAPARVAASAPQATALAPLPSAAASQPVAPIAPIAPPAPPALGPVARPPFRPDAVPMPRAEEVVPQVAAAASAAKAAAPAIEVKSPIKSLTEEIEANWLPIGIGAASGVGTYLAFQGAKALLKNRSVRGSPMGGTGSTPQVQTATSPAAQQQRVDPVFASPEETAAHEAQTRAAAEQRQRRLDEFNRQWQDQNAIRLGGVREPAPLAPAPAPAPAPATAAAEPESRITVYQSPLIENPNRTSPWDPVMIEAPAAATAPAIAEEAPKTALAIETQQPGNKVAEAVVLDELNKPAATPAPPTPAPEPAPEPDKTVAGRTRRTQTQIADDLAKAFAAAPPGMRPSAPQKTNKLPGDVIGQGGWHFYAGQGGTEEDWLRLYGRNPQPYNRVVADIKGGVLPVPPAPPGSKGGAVPRQPYVPEFIKGRADPKSLTGLAAIAAALGIAGSEQGREAMGRAAAAIKDLGISPDILQNKAEELGRLGQGYVTAGNPAYLREISKQLETETDPSRRAILMQEFQKASGRGMSQPMR